MFDAEVGEAVVVHGHAATQPLVGQALLAEFVESSGTADAVEGGVQPQGHKDAGIIGVSSGDALSCLNGLVEGGEVESFDVSPDEACLVVVGQELVQGQTTHLDLVAFGEAKTARVVWSVHIIALRTSGPNVEPYGKKFTTSPFGNRLRETLFRVCFPRH